MKSILRKISTAFVASPQNESEARKYYEMTKQPGWQVYLSLLRIIQTQIIDDIFSEKFTELPSLEKDIRQRAYQMVVEVLHFLDDPMAKGRELAKVRQHNAAMEATMKGATKTNKGTT